MQKGTAYIGLDVHKASIAAAIASDDGKPPTLLGTIANDPAAVRKLVAGVQHGFDEVRAAYEAGPTGYGVQRQLSAMGIECRVVAPAQIPRRANERVKTDRRDALKLARLLRSGDLEPIWVPDESHEALRSLVRARADAHADLLRDRHRLNNFLMTRGLHGPVGARMSSTRYDRWLETLHFERPAERVVFDDSRDVIRGGVQRERHIETALYECARDSRHAGLIRALQALRGVGELTAITIVTEVGDFRRFATAPHLMAYVGLTPLRTLQRGGAATWPHHQGGQPPASPRPHRVGAPRAPDAAGQSAHAATPRGPPRTRGGALLACPAAPPLPLPPARRACGPTPSGGRRGP